MKKAVQGAAAIVAAATFVVSACGNTTNGAAPSGGEGGAPPTTRSAAELTTNIPSTQPGVTDTEIRVTSIGAITNVLGADYTQAPNGTQAYFDMINSQGGIYGRKLVLVDRIDDQMTKNKESAQKVVSANEVFAVLPVTSVVFTGADELADAGIPTYGWAINAEWSGPENLFGEKGSFVDFGAGNPAVPWVAKQVGAKKPGIVAFGVDQSVTCARGVTDRFQQAGLPIAFTDDTIPFGNTDFSVPVTKMKEEGIDFVVLCMDTNTSINLAREMKKQGVTAPLFLQQAYEEDLLAQYGDVLEGSYVYAPFAPLESSDLPPGLQDYKEWIAKVPGAKTGELSLAGWRNADLFYRGLVAAGPEFTRRTVIDATNAITDWSADGIIQPIDWTKAHNEGPNPLCSGITIVKGGKYEPAFPQSGTNFICFPTDGTPTDNPERR